MFLFFVKTKDILTYTQSNVMGNDTQIVWIMSFPCSGHNYTDIQNIPDRYRRLYILDYI